MRYLRWLLSASVALYALMSAVPASLTLLYKLHLLVLPDGAKSNGALMDAMSWPRVILWWAVAILFFVAAWRLAFAQGRAWLVFTIAYVGDVLGWLWRQGPAYDATFPPDQRRTDLAIFAALAVVGALIAWVELRKTRAN
ncbi:MAG: hypothetical protein H7236_15665 [Gemmatimonadaceae bacterium]|nr:hypothetical protein [Caulobacter sp.]